MWDALLRAMRFGPYARYLHEEGFHREPLCAVSAWAVAHGAIAQSLESNPLPD